MDHPPREPAKSVRFFEWDPAKNDLNIRNHGLSFWDATRVFDGLMVTYLDDREDYGEDRWVGIGLLAPRSSLSSLQSLTSTPSASSRPEGQRVMTDSGFIRVSATDWERLDAMSDEDIDFSDIPEVTEEQLKRATLRLGPRPRVSLHVDAEVLAWIKRYGDDWERRIHDAMREYVENHRDDVADPPTSKAATKRS
jgi:uncharacterized protein (DUF4415 family)